MGNFIKLTCIAMILLITSGCANDMSSVNALIAQSNAERPKAFASAMAACKGEQGCLVGVSMAYAGNIGQQAYFKPETAKDYLEAGLPYAGILSQMYMIGKGRSGGSNTGGITIVGDHNVLMDMNNEKTATDNSSIVDSNTGSSERLIDMMNRKYNLGTTDGSGSLTDGGVAYEPIVVPGVATGDTAIPTTSGLPQ